MQYQWKTLIPSHEPKHRVKGSELEQALCGQNSRFALISVRCYDTEGHSDLRYRLRDASTISDIEVEESRRPKIVAEFPTIEECEEWIKNNS